MPSAPTEAPSASFRCHGCGGTEHRVVVRSTRRGVDERGVSLQAYACTNRGHGSFTHVVECTRCRLRTLHPQPEATIVEQAYESVEDPHYLTIESTRRIAFRKLVRRLNRFRRPPGKLLDVGCDTGIFPFMAREAGWDAWGIEPTAWAVRVGNERLPGRVRQGFLRDTPYEPASFDVVTSWDVIEHVTNPTEEIRAMARLLKPGGWVFLSTMHAEAPFVRLMGPRWPWYMDMHLFYFTPETLGSFIKNAGLAVKGIESYPHYSSVEYIFWKLESLFGPLARAAGKAAKGLSLADTVVKVDLGDFFLLAAQKPK